MDVGEPGLDLLEALGTVAQVAKVAPERIRHVFELIEGIVHAAGEVSQARVDGLGGLEGYPEAPELGKPSALIA